MADIQKKLRIAEAYIKRLEAENKAAMDENARLTAVIDKLKREIK